MIIGWELLRVRN